MNPDYLFNQKRIVAKNTLAIKVQVHGLNCEVEVPDNYLSPYGEESGRILYHKVKEPTRVIIVNSTQETMKASSKELSSTENPDLYLVMFEDDILPRNSRIKIFMQNGSYRQLKVQDNMKNEGTFIIQQQLVPCVNTVDGTDPNVGRNIPLEESISEETGEVITLQTEYFKGAVLSFNEEVEVSVTRQPIGNNL